MPAAFENLPVTGWYPRHMLKAGKDIAERLRLVDVIVEILDARLPTLSRNPTFDKLFGEKPRHLVFNKADLVPEDFIKSWTDRLREEGSPCTFVDSLHGDKKLADLPRQWTEHVKAIRKRRGATRPLLRPVRAMIAGIPNVGKSTLINRLIATRRTRVGPRPGITRAQEWVRLPDGTELLDTPGVMWPRVQDKIHELKLGLIGSIKDDLLGEELLAEFLHTLLVRHAERVRWELYDLDGPCETGEDLVEAVGRRRGLLRGGGEIDTRQSALTLLADFRQGRLGTIPVADPNDTPTQSK